MNTDNLQTALQRMRESLCEAAKRLGEFFRAYADAIATILRGVNFTQLLKTAKVQAALSEAPPKVRHLAKHGKKYRTRKKNINRALRDYEKKRRR